MTMESLKEAMAKKDSMEAEIKALSDVLESQGNVGMEGVLVDAEGYPRSDIDVYSVRHARHRIICLQNDHKILMKEIEVLLHKVHAEAREAKEMETDTSKMDISESPSTLRNPFATVDRVDAGSPAESSGLHVGDKLVQFGSITSDNFKDLKSIGTVVQHSKDKPVHVSVIREEKELNLSLTPKTWSGRGLLGCNIVPSKT